LLRCWIGPRPPSTEFKNNILNLPTGEGGAELLARYEALLPVSGRNKTMMAWREGNSQAAALAAIRTAAPAAKAEAPRPTPKAEQPKTPPARQQKAAKVKPKPEPAPAKAERIAAALNTPQTTADAKAAAAPAAKQAEKAAVAADVISPDARPKLATSSVAKTEPAEQTILEQAAKAAAPTEPQIKENGLLSLYKSNLLKRVYGFVIYPERAIDRNQEGTVVLQVTVNRKGKVLSIKNDEPSRYRLLNSAATRAIKKASPFPAAPRKLKGSKFDLEFPIVFRIPRS
jgi:TonB family protein